MVTGGPWSASCRSGSDAVVKTGCFDLRQRLRVLEVFLWRSTSPAFIWEQTAGPAAYCAMAGRPAARGSAAFSAARRFSLLDGCGWQFGERCHGEFGSRGGMRALLLPKPVIGWGADGVVLSGAGWCRSASDSVQQLPFDQGFLAFVLVGGLCGPLSHRRAPRTAPNSAEERVSAGQQRRAA
jgi:hypothetical protein